MVLILEIIVTVCRERLAALQIIKELKVESALLILETKNLVVEKSIRNLPKYKVLRVEGLNPYDLLKYDHILVTTAAFKKIEEMV